MAYNRIWTLNSPIGISSLKVTLADGVTIVTSFDFNHLTGRVTSPAKPLVIVPSLVDFQETVIDLEYWFKTVTAMVGFNPLPPVSFDASHKRQQNQMSYSFKIQGLVVEAKFLKLPGTVHVEARDAMDLSAGEFQLFLNVVQRFIAYSLET